MAISSCDYCNSTRVYSVDTFKHVWGFCDQCGTARRHRKDVYPASALPWPELRPAKKVLTDGSAIYDYFGSDTITKSSLGSFAYVMQDLFARLGISPCGKSVLDISGDNGTVTHEFVKAGAAFAAMTEYNRLGVEYARKSYGVRAELYDINKDNLSRLFESPFDVVLIRHIIPFILDFDSFLPQLAATMKSGGLVYYRGSVWPNIAPALRWQLDDYTYNVLYEPDFVLKKHADHGFEQMVSEEQELYLYTRDWQDDRIDFALNYEREARKTLLGTKHQFLNPYHRHQTFIFRKP